MDLLGRLYRDAIPGGEIFRYDRKISVAPTPKSHILVFVMKSTTRKANEITFHVTIKELIHNFLVSFEDIVNDTPYEDLQYPLGTVDIIADLRSGDPTRIRKVFKDGASVILIPAIPEVDSYAYVKVHVTLPDGDVLPINHEDINY